MGPFQSIDQISIFTPAVKMLAVFEDYPTMEACSNPPFSRDNEGIPRGS